MQLHPSTMTISLFVTLFGALIAHSGTLASQQLPTNSLTEVMRSHFRSVSPKQASAECTEEEYDRRIDALLCNEDYVEAVRDGIARSTCRNLIFYTEDFYESIENDCEPVIDSRANVDNNCSLDCSQRQFNYYTCTYLWDDVVDVNEECAVETGGFSARVCEFDEGDFCLNRENLIQPLFDACIRESRGEEECSETCRDAVEKFREEAGCCAYSFIIDDEGFTNGEVLRGIFSACDVDVPSRSQQCASSSPPQEFLECAGIEPVEPAGAAAITAPIYIASLIVAVISALV